ncbi:hypothetical protein [Psychrobacillus sp. NPDC096623]
MNNSESNNNKNKNKQSSNSSIRAAELAVLGELFSTVGGVISTNPLF